MTNRWVSRARAARARLRDRHTPLAAGMSVASPRDAPAPRVTTVDESSWLVEAPAAGQAGGSRRVVPIGEPDLATTLLTPGRRVRGLKQSHLYEHRLLEHVAHGHLSWLLNRLAIDVVLDVGANRGQYAGRLRASGYRGHIISFEPVPASLEVLQRASRDDPRWDVVPYALGRADGEAQITVNDTLSSLLDASDFGKEWKESMAQPPTETITVRRLDGVLDELLAGSSTVAPRIYLKLDTQGFDLEAFAGLGERVSDVLGMQSELSCLPIYDGMPSLTEQLDTYTAAGFSLSGMYPVSRHVPTLRVIEFDAFLVRDPAPDRPDRHR